MTEIKSNQEPLGTYPATAEFTAEDRAVPDLEDHIIDLDGAVSALFHVPSFDSPAGVYLIGRIREHADGIRRAYYHLPQPAGD